MDFCVELPYSYMMDDAKLDEAASQGIANISVPYELFESTPKEKLKERSDALISRGIKADTAHPRFGIYNSNFSLVNQYAVQRGAYLEQLKDGFERMSILGVKYAPLHTGGACLPTAPEWALEMCAESVSAVLAEAMSCGIILTMENTFFTLPHGWDGCVSAVGEGRPAQSTKIVYDDMGKLCRLIDGLASPNVKGCYDVGHAHYLGDISADYRMMGDRIALYHLHDNNRSKDMHLPPGYGTLDWETFGGLINSCEVEFAVYIEANPWTLGKYGLMIRETRALLSGGRMGESRRCLKCGHSLLHDIHGEFCACT